MSLNGVIQPEKFKNDGQFEQPVENQWIVKIFADEREETKRKNPNHQSNGKLNIIRNGAKPLKKK